MLDEDPAKRKAWSAESSALVYLPKAKGYCYLLMLPVFYKCSHFNYIVNCICHIGLSSVWNFPICKGHQNKITVGYTVMI